MHKIDNHSKFVNLRKSYPYFIYQSYSITRTKTTLRAEFFFNLSDKYYFRPVIEITERPFYNFDQLGNEAIDNLVFHVGMVELISYWKTACPPKVFIKPHRLDQQQINWWKKLYFNGLGEFFYLNNIKTDSKAFMKISSEGSTVKISEVPLNPEKVLVPVGGGKDSVVSLELLKNSKFQVIPFVLNPGKASIRTIKISGFEIKTSILVNRALDPELIKLNEKGFLNGHTPFSSLLAFVSAFTALSSGSKYVALSNENSANQSTVPDTKINHQYSKSFEFELDFSLYLSTYIHPELRYFSFLRPLNELQIAKLFSGFSQHFMSFRSCNAGSKTDSWCCSCPKCLFTYIILSPFVPNDKLREIFGDNLLENRYLTPIFKELTGMVGVKPFECVGTTKEVNVALWKTAQLLEKDKLPPLMNNFKAIFNHFSAIDFDNLLKTISPDHQVPEHFLNLINAKMNERKV